MSFATARTGSAFGQRLRDENEPVAATTNSLLCSNWKLDRSLRVGRGDSGTGLLRKNLDRLLSPLKLLKKLRWLALIFHHSVGSLDLRVKRISE